MKPYLLTTGTVFAVITLVHIWRIVEEAAAPARNPWFILITVLAAALSIWAFRLLRRTTGA